MRVGGSERAARTDPDYIATPAHGQTPSSELWSLAGRYLLFLVNQVCRWMARRVDLAQVAAILLWHCNCSYLTGNR